MTSNGIRESITLNNCQYTPVYLIQKSSLAQGRSYVLSPAVKEDKKAVTSNLKLFYENSGSLENGVIINDVPAASTGPAACKAVSAPAAVPAAVPASAKVQETVGNNLKLASFLVPKKDATKQQYIATISNKILTPKASSADANILPSVNIISNHKGNSSKKASSTRTLLKPRLLPKIKPKENTQESSKHTAVHLLKLGGTYHSLNQLSDEQLRLVNQALEKIHNDPGDPRGGPVDPREPRALKDTAPGTRVIYKIVSPNDLKLVGKNKLLLKSAAKKEARSKAGAAAVTAAGAEATGGVAAVGGAGCTGAAPARGSDSEPDEDPVLSTEIKVTRSGRAVKLPRHIQQSLQEPPPRARRKTAALSCFHCNTEFTGLYRLQRHYERNPTHLPSHTHTNLFHCLLAAVEAGGGAALLQQLQLLLARLRAVLPCLLQCVDGVEGTMCDVDEDVGRLFGLNPGQYNLNVDALNCTKDKEGYCSHSPKPVHAPAPAPAPAPIPLPLPVHIPTPVSLPVPIPAPLPAPAPLPIQVHIPAPAPLTIPVHIPAPALPEVKITFAPAAPEPTQAVMEEVPADTESEDCARVHPVDGWTLNREWKRKCEHDAPASKKVKAEATEPLIELGTEFQDVAELLAQRAAGEAPAGSHSQFYSAHFDIRSSPIKPSAAVFSKFQLSADALPERFGVLKPLSFPAPEPPEPPADSQHSITTSENSLDVIIKELSSGVCAASALVDNIDSLCKTDSLSKTDFKPALSYDNPRDWTLAPPRQEKPSNVVVPMLLNGGGFNFNESSSFNGLNDEISDSLCSLSQGASVLQFLDSLSNDCLPCPETELRNNPIDFQLDLFSFNPA